ncbi:hypothetical protein BWD08_10755 [Neisseria animaloris]|nr:hypothetical protein BWD08_10755 [Neisseria animaloris]
MDFCICSRPLVYVAGCVVCGGFIGIAEASDKIVFLLLFLNIMPVFTRRPSENLFSDGLFLFFL